MKIHHGDNEYSFLFFGIQNAVRESLYQNPSDFIFEYSPRL